MHRVSTARHAAYRASHRKPIARIVAAIGVAAVAAAIVTPAAFGASSTARSHSVGRFNHATIDRNGVLRVQGWSFDPAVPKAHVAVVVKVDGRVVTGGRTHVSRPDVPKVYKRTKPTATSGFAITKKTSLAPGAHNVCLYGWNAARKVETRLQCVVRHRTDLNQRLASYAKKFVGHYRYRSGGSKPSTGFDCSGLTAYVYKHAINRHLAHYTQTQWHEMRHVSRPNAKPGDVVFFFAGSHTYHVGIYEGHGMMVAAATSREGIRYQKIWTSRVKFGTLTH